MMCENIADGGATQVVDLRSDFVARPTPAMVEAMLRAARQPCGFGLREDTIVADLENRAAEVIGKDDALFVPTCTMAYRSCRLRRRARFSSTRTSSMFSARMYAPKALATRYSAV